MEDDLRSVEHEPADGQPDDEGDVNRLPESRLGALVVQGIQKMDDLVLFEVAVAIGTHLDGCAGRRSGVGGRLERGHELCCCDGCDTRKLRLQTQKPPGRPPRFAWSLLFSHLWWRLRKGMPRHRIAKP